MAGGTLVYSGQTAVDANDQPQDAGDMVAQLNLALDKVDPVLQAAGFTLGDVLGIALPISHSQPPGIARS